MKGIDIIEAMNRIDESLIIGAKQHKRSAPTWMRFIAMAACFCCIVAIGAFSIQSILTPVTEEVSPGALTSTPEETISIPPTAEPTEAPNVVLNSNQYDLELSVPEEYVDNFRVDIPFSYESPSSDYLYIDSAVFSFYMAFSEEDQMDGFLWLIEATEKTAFSQAAYEEGLRLNYLMNRSILGSDETYIYSLYHPGIPHADCFDDANLEEVQTYYDHAMDGLSILEQFVADNSLESDGSWKSYYTEKTLQPVADILQELGDDITDTPETSEPATTESSPEIIRLAVHYETEFSMLGNIVNSFNETHDNYQVELLDMREYVPNNNSLILEGVKGWESVLDTIDNIDLISSVPSWAAVLGKAGYLADLNEYIKTDNILPSLWNTTKTGDNNYCLPFEYHIQTVYGKSELVGTNSNLNVDEFLSLAEFGIPLFPDMTSMGYISDLSNFIAVTYVDFGSGTCRFDSEDFIKLLDYANTLPQTVSPLYEDWYKYLRYNEALFLNVSLAGFQTIHEDETTYIDAPLTMTGWPNEKGGGFNVIGGVALTTEGANNAGAIAFLEYAISDSVQEEIMDLYFPVTISSIDAMCQSMLESPDTNYIYNNSNTETIDGETYQYEPITEEQLEKYKEWMNGIDTLYTWSDEITIIVKEEAATMVGGSQTAEEAANRIQARVTEYLDELFN